jgi:predicted AAA+ superfamily ATPase
MRYVVRELEGQFRLAAKRFPAVVLTGPRRAGKTCLLQHLLPEADYVLLEDPDAVARFRHDPQGFLDSRRPPVVLDEVQNVPEVFSYVRTRIDREPRQRGRWFLTGSQEAPLMQGVTESMAGRAAVLQLLPMSVRETSRVSVLQGGFPEAIAAAPRSAGLWFASYVQTYLERDVRSVTAVRDLATFRRFLALLASRHGQVLNKSDLAAPLGVSVPTIGQWLGVLEITAQILVVPPFYENLGKRLIKSPKVYLADSGLACHLLGIDTEAELEKSPFLGVLFEGFVAGEIVKAQAHSGRRREIYYFRDQQGLEVDFVVPGKGGTLRLVEVKTTRTPTPDMVSSLERLRASFRRRPRARRPLQLLLVHRRARRSLSTTAIAPGVQAVPLDDFVRQPLR